MEDLSLHILDIAENSIAAGARTIRILVTEDIARDLLCVEIADDGKGMSDGVAEIAADPFYTTRTTRRVGLGLALLREAAVTANGTLDVRSVPDAGTTIRATFELSNIDRKPLGSMAETISALIAASAGVDILYTHARNGKTILFDTREIRSQLGDVPLNSVEALNVIRRHLIKEEDSLVH